MNQYIRNFCIIAHIDHGKSTLADRLIDASHFTERAILNDQVLDNLEVERERGITVKSQAIYLPYENPQDKQLYHLNLIDTPGHVDFAYEVSRSIASCEGAILLIDATQGIQAQTLSNFYMALEKNLSILPVINKIDLPNLNLDHIYQQIEYDLGLAPEEVLCISAKNNIGIDTLLQRVCSFMPPPQGLRNKALQALIFDSHYDNYKGVILHVRIVQGTISIGDTILCIYSHIEYKVEELGVFQLKQVKRDNLYAGEVGYVIANIRSINAVYIGDTITHKNNVGPALEGFQVSKPMVFASFYPIQEHSYENLAKAMEKLQLNDASLVYEKQFSAALGFGFHCGFLGLLHMEIIQERLEKEFDINLIITPPSVIYRITNKKNHSYDVHNPIDYPSPQDILHIEEPYIQAKIITPDQFLGNILQLCSQKRGIQKKLFYLSPQRIELIYEMPLSEILFDFFDKLKAASKGYASFEYELTHYQATQLVKLKILLNGDDVDILSQLIYAPYAYTRARSICKILKSVIPRQQIPIAIQGAIEKNIIARETISAFRKDVTAKCYGGDISRKRKLLEKQKEGKKRMKKVGNIDLPQKAFLAVLKIQED